MSLETGELRRPSVLLKVLLGLGLLGVAAVVLVPVVLLPGRWARRFARESIGGGTAALVLRLWGVRVAVQGRERWAPGRQAVYVSNHTCSIDPFVVAALGLEDSRWFLSRYLFWVWPFGLAAKLLGTFFTPLQSDRAARVRCFSRACATLARTGESVYLTPEGEMVRTGRIGRFNKGAFHLAIALGVPLRPFFVEVPAAIDPGRGFAVKPGTVTVHVLEEIPTTGWKLEELDERRASVQARFEAFHESLRAGT